MKTIELKNIEQWREYEWIVPETRENRVYRIGKPERVVIGETTHRVIDADGIVHCVPAPGHFGCVLRWSGAIVA
jgi:hypothetical protein